MNCAIAVTIDDGNDAGRARPRPHTPKTRQALLVFLERMLIAYNAQDAGDALALIAVNAKDDDGKLAVRILECLQIFDATEAQPDGEINDEFATFLAPRITLVKAVCEKRSDVKDLMAVCGLQQD